MDTMNRTGIWQQATETRLQKLQKKALRKNRPLKVFSPKELQYHIGHGWQILSHTPSSYGRPQSWLLVPKGTL